LAWPSAIIRKNTIAEQLLQLRVLGFGLLQDGNVGVGVFPEGEEVFVGGERSRIVASTGNLSN